MINKYTTYYLNAKIVYIRIIYLIQFNLKYSLISLVKHALFSFQIVYWFIAIFISDIFLSLINITYILCYAHPMWCLAVVFLKFILIVWIFQLARNASYNDVVMVTMLLWLRICLRVFIYDLTMFTESNKTLTLK